MHAIRLPHPRGGHTDVEALQILMLLPGSGAGVRKDETGIKGDIALLLLVHPTTLAISLPLERESSVNTNAQAYASLKAGHVSCGRRQTTSTTMTAVMTMAPFPHASEGLLLGDNAGTVRRGVTFRPGIDDILKQADKVRKDQETLRQFMLPPPCPSAPPQKFGRQETRLPQTLDWCVGPPLTSSSILRSVTDGDFSFSLEAVKILKSLLQASASSTPNPPNIGMPAVCANPSLPVEFLAVCQGEAAGVVFERLGALSYVKVDIITPPDPCEICANAACTGC
ncbi:hypothetical protein AAFF_G00096120 [Aldrovandia affinis]|uniref:Guanylate cyclase activator 2B n=1 Tax=Aldrovandia affinis TaxID=143900 RepID=A0AAD7WC25_9TELE|nr:hypothetical protein AAFF_G00096120 [Aldrovandia affinis]